MEKDFLTITHKREDVSVVTLMKSEISMPEVQEVKEDLLNLIDEGSEKLVIDFSQVRLISSALLAVLVSCLKKINQAGGRICLCSINPQIMEIFQLTNLNKAFKIYPSESKAMTSFK